MSRGNLLRRPRWWPLGLFAGLVLLAITGLWLWGYAQQQADIAETLQTAQPWLTLWRFIVYGIVLGGWPWWLTGLSRYRKWDESYHAHLLALRWRLAAWLLLLEGMLAQNLVGCFVHGYLVPGTGG